MEDLFQLAERGLLDRNLERELLKSARDPKTRSLLHVCDDPETLRFLLASGLDANALDADGLTPLMRYGRKAESNRVLLQAGADVNALDPHGNSALAYQAGALIGWCGYCRPDFAALDVLTAAGAHPPSPSQAQNWIQGAHDQVTSGGEAIDARSFERWVLRLNQPA